MLHRSSTQQDLPVLALAQHEAFSTLLNELYFRELEIQAY